MFSDSIKKCSKSKIKSTEKFKSLPAKVHTSVSKYSSVPPWIQPKMLDSLNSQILKD